MSALLASNDSLASEFLGEFVVQSDISTPTALGLAVSVVVEMGTLNRMRLEILYAFTRTSLYCTSEELVVSCLSCGAA